MSTKYRPTYAEQPPIFDQLRFPNTAVEAPLRRDFEHALTQAIRLTDGLLIDQGKALSKEIHRLHKAATAVTRELEEIETALSNDQDVDLERWSVLDAQVGELAAKAESYPHRVEAIEARLEDPMTYATELQERFPSLHRPNLLPSGF